MGKKVLVIEDEHQFIEAYKLIFQKEGVDVLFANNGKVGIDMALENKPDVILLDLVMPEMDGYTFLTTIDNMPEINKIPIFVLSSLPKSAVVSSISMAHVKGFLSKAEYTPRKVLDEIEKYF